MKPTAILFALIGLLAAIIFAGSLFLGVLENAQLFGDY